MSEYVSIRRVFTDMERRIFENYTKGKVLREKSELLYYTSKKNDVYPEYRLLYGIPEFDKVMLRDRGSDNPLGLNEAIDSIFTSKGSLEELLDSYGAHKTDRSFMDMSSHNRPDKFGRLASGIGHWNGLSMFGGSGKVYLHIPARLTAGWDLQLLLEILSAAWLEPNQRSERVYQCIDLASGHDFVRKVLEDQDILKRIIAYQKGKNDQFTVEYLVNKYFNGDAVAFQKRWKQFYENWWPGEFLIMQQCAQEIKDWLLSQKD